PLPRPTPFPTRRSSDLQLEEEGFEVNYFKMSDYGVPADYELVFVSNDDTIENDPELLRAFLRASEKGFEDMKNDPDGSLDLLLRDRKSTRLNSSHVSIS